MVYAQAEPDFDRLHSVAVIAGPSSVLVFTVFIIILMLNGST